MPSCAPPSSGTRGRRRQDTGIDADLRDGRLQVVLVETIGTGLCHIAVLADGPDSFLLDLRPLGSAGHKESEGELPPCLPIFVLHLNRSELA